MPTFHVINDEKNNNLNHQRFISQIKSTISYISWQDATFTDEAIYLAKKIAKKLPDLSSNNVVLVIGDDTVLNETLNGLLAVKRKYELPIAYIPINADTNFSNKLNIKTKQSALHHLQYITHPKFLAISKITGDIPKRQTKYFVNSLGIGFDVALTTHQNNKIIHQKKSVFHSIKNYFAIATAFCNQKKFPVTVNFCSEYRHFPDSFLLTLTNKFNLDDISSSNNLIEKATLEMIVVRKISIVEFFINMLFKHNNPQSNIVHRVPLSKGDTIHVHDIQPGHLDGTDLGNGSFSFSVRQQSYPFWV